MGSPIGNWLLRKLRKQEVPLPQICGNSLRWYKVDEAAQYLVTLQALASEALTLAGYKMTII
jgi:hypothetical protein